MLGNILQGLTDADVAEEMLAAIGDEALLARVESAAGAAGVDPGIFVAATVRHLIDRGGDELWLDLVGKMANSPQPGVVALQASLASAFRAPLKS